MMQHHGHISRPNTSAKLSVPVNIPPQGVTYLVTNCANLIPGHKALPMNITTQTQNLTAAFTPARPLSTPRQHPSSPAPSQPSPPQP